MKKILIVDDNLVNIKVLVGTLKNEFNLLSAQSGSEAISLALEQIPDLILLDIMMPQMDGYEVFTRLREIPQTSQIPVIFITALSEEADEERALDMGAIDFITKPFSPVLVRKRVQNHIELKTYRDHLEQLVDAKTDELKKTRLEIIRKLGRAAEYKDNETGVHIIRMSKYCKCLAEGLGLEKKKVELIYHASPMHDIGKIGIPDAILQKPTALDSAERAIVQQHCEIGYKILGGNENTISLLRVASDIALQHHERWDGTGYPNGLKEEKISIFARIVSVADVMDALCSKRPYKEAWPFDKVCKYLHENSGLAFDPEIIEVFNSQILQIEEIMNIYREN